MTHLERLTAALREGRGFRHKRDIAKVMPHLNDTAGVTAVPNGDDCAVLPVPGGDGHLLLAIEGLMQDFVKAMPWFAGYSGVMVNLSDIAAMGGRATAVVDALWSADEDTAGQVLAGMREACERYGVPLVGGHTNLQARQGQLAVAVLGHARRLLSSFAARPGDRLLMAVDLRGRWQGDHAFWNASTDAPPQRLREDLALLPELAEAGLCDAAKDISMAGALGTLLMMLECSGVGARIDIERIPLPSDAPSWQDDSDEAGSAHLRWLSAFPSFGFVLAVREANADEVFRRFAERDIACADIGVAMPGTKLLLELANAQTTLWDLGSAPFIGSGPSALEPRIAA
jgi:AIR synthase-related protein